MASQRIASALSHRDDTTGFVPGIGYEEGNMSLSTDAIIVDIEASLDCLYGEDVDLDWEQILAPVSLGEGILFNGCDGTEAEIENPYLSSLVNDSCACAQSTYWASLSGVNCSAIPTMYFYHPDYLGSVEFVTDMSGDPCQFFLNTIWGGNLQNQMALSTTTFSSRFRFNGKEWDEETGNFYYGARYMDPHISMWLSVDPKAYAFPSVTPYSVMMNNPINMIDPGGDSTYVFGDQAQMLVDDLNKSSDLTITRDEKSGRLSASGEAVTDADKELLASINSDDCNTIIYANDKDDMQTNGKNYAIDGGVFMGGFDEGKNGKPTSIQLVNVTHTRNIESAGGRSSGVSITHELLEAWSGVQRGDLLFLKDVLGTNRQKEFFDRLYTPSHNQAIEWDKVRWEDYDSPQTYKRVIKGKTIDVRTGR
ncbi:RHS repeat domain-containing protein [Croceimicrobium hydrocarbonivorans]|uniref:RHS repeat-associated core domain-containing protein n=1 Tax=Croceimicrobium hydrocarbonivorans TaxID=2761580 RepID=A0A7H0VIX1_9FLAO|nr:RHS repeat-associated core domain-containing protein [Croceimicrobium hydrocarbonivorans]QNR25669.1 RHS repeat-associated core domain-containing protein [Croceimicrobium hydrocarbonivorans]